MLPLGAGLSIGLVASLGVNRLLEAELVQVSPSPDRARRRIGRVDRCLDARLPRACAPRVDPVVALRPE
jgi:hypothetical protein